MIRCARIGAVLQGQCVCVCVCVCVCGICVHVCVRACVGRKKQACSLACVKLAALSVCVCVCVRVCVCSVCACVCFEHGESIIHNSGR